MNISRRAHKRQLARANWVQRRSWKRAQVDLMRQLPYAYNHITQMAYLRGTDFVVRNALGEVVVAQRGMDHVVPIEVWRKAYIASPAPLPRSLRGKLPRRNRRTRVRPRR